MSRARGRVRSPMARFCRWLAPWASIWGARQVASPRWASDAGLCYVGRRWPLPRIYCAKSGPLRNSQAYARPERPERRRGTLGAMPFTPPKPIPPTPEDLRGSTVLVVDDERAWRVILETDLKMLGYKVSMAEDADQALVRAQADKPEVAIIDLMLPEPMDGWGLLTELRVRGQKVPVIFYTAYPVFPSGTDDPDVVGYMSKAVDRADLYALLPVAIRRSRERRDSD
ncbi:MAG: response regulator [Chloroflexi bacterium]|nr:MAG: response regulator [Chloroflexota bacterium]